MSDTPVVVDRPRKGVYVGDGDGDGGWERRPHRHRSFRACGSFLSRLLAAASSVVGLVCMLVANQTSLTPNGYFSARWEDFSGYKWLVIANCVVIVYSILSAIAAVLFVCFPRGPHGYFASPRLMLVFDILGSLISLSGAAAALAVNVIASNGNPIWPNFCNYTSRFCNFSEGAIISTFIGTYFSVQSTIVSASALR